MLASSFDGVQRSYPMRPRVVFLVCRPYFDEVHAIMAQAFDQFGVSHERVDTATYAARPAAERDEDLRLHIVLGSTREWPRQYIYCQYEQMSGPYFSTWHWQRMRGALHVWDFSPSKVEQLRRNGLACSHLLPGFMPALVDVDVSASISQEPTVDVLFYGPGHLCREALLQRLTDAGLVVRNSSSLWGAARAAAVRDARIVLNLHYHPKASLEIHRINYVLAIGACVVSEPSSDAELDREYADMVLFADSESDALVQCCLKYARDDALRREFARRAAERFRERPFVERLRAELLIRRHQIPLLRHALLGATHLFPPVNVVADTLAAAEPSLPPPATPARKAMIIDCFTFNDELDMLEKRLLALNDLVDRFVIVEATQTFSGAQKPLHFCQHSEEPRFASFQHKIELVAVDDMPTQGGAWAREHHQRNAISAGVRRIAGARPDDIVLIGDVDEIPSPAMLRLRSWPTMPIACVQRMFYYSLRWEKRTRWCGTIVCTLQQLLGHTPQGLRFLRCRLPRMMDAGWHLSYFGDAAWISKKIQSFSHQEYNQAQFSDPARIAERLRTGKDAFDRDGVEELMHHDAPPSDIPAPFASLFADVETEVDDDAVTIIGKCCSSS